jgi:hypothetical protein
MTLPMSACKKRLTVVWFAGAGLVCVIVLLQTLIGHYGDKVSDVWGWLMPAVMPTFALIAAVWTIDVRSKETKSEFVDSFVFWLALGLSITYLSVLALTILVQPLVVASPEGYVDLMHRSGFFIGPFQGVVTASLGAFFVKKESESGPSPKAEA